MLNPFQFAAQAEFESLALPHTPELLRFARRLSGDAAYAEDLVQDTLLKAWHGFRQFERGTNFRAWLFRILVNTFHRNGRTAPTYVPLSARLPGNGGDELQRLEVLQAFDSLPIEQQTVLLLSIVEGFTSRETSDILSIPIGTVMSRLSRGRDALRNKLTLQRIPHD